MKNIVLSAVAVLAMSSFAVAGGDIAPVEEPVVVVEEVVSEGAFYVGAAYSVFGAETYAWNDYDESIDAELDFDAFMLQVGYKFNQYIAVEARYWNAIGDGDLTGTYRDGDYSETLREDDVTDGDLGAAAWGIYVKPMYPVTDAFDIYALLGYANTDTDFAIDQDSFDDGAFSWGLGVAYSFTENLAVFADYVSLYDDETDYVDYSQEDTIDTWNFGLTYSF